MQAPPVITAMRPRFPWLWAGALAVAAIIVATVFFFFDPSHYGFYPRCMVYTMTGLECPGCGSQRAFYHLLHGHVAAALRCNALFVLGLPVFAFVFVRFLARWKATGAMPVVNLPPRWLIVLAAAGVIAFTILRNLPGAPFIYLAPP